MKNSEITKAFLNYISPAMKNEILSNVAKHYEISNEEANQELVDQDAESLMDYITGTSRSAISIIFNQFKIYHS